ncbi:MAG: hypothetical protein GQ574_06570 [Crocinitomix sp.]|nr:hypothetical protein [Crocinitomix sp.]
MKGLLLLCFCTFHMLSFSQTAWTWGLLDSMPARAANNAVAYGTDDVYDYVFSFGGIDSSKIHTGVNNRAFRYSIGTDSWEEIAPLPFAQTNIASGASNVKNMIYIIGGYHVNPGGSEVSSNEVIRYNPETNAYLSNGANIPTPIDDHVQCVWRDSLIYVVTGWSNTGNVPNVQIYDAELDTWLTGTETPNDNTYKAFGASGEIIGDTIYYYGGASTGINFPAQKFLRKGVINAENPTEIGWTLLEDGPTTLYRSAALTYGDYVFWAGGSAISYNYNGVAYNGSGGVPPLNQIMRYDHTNGNWNQGEGAPYAVMDLRGIAQISPTEWIICGGMEAEQYVSNKTYLLTYDPVVGSLNEVNSEFEIKLINRQVIIEQPAKNIAVYSVDGKLLATLDLNDARIPDHISGIIIIRVELKKSSKPFVFSL